MTLKKTEVFSSLLAQLDLSFNTATRAADSARDLATHEQSKPETQYDTVGLEASYLAHGQSQRVAELALAIEDWRTLVNKSFHVDAEISAGALVHLLDMEGRFAHYLIGNYSGGLKLKVGGVEVTVISVSSPLGKAMHHKCVGDEINHPVIKDLTLEVSAVS